MVSPTVTCKNVIEDNQICNHTQQIGQDVVCSNCGADLINQYINDVMDPTLELPAADVVQIVRCKDCKHLMKDIVTEETPYGFDEDRYVFGCKKFFESSGEWVDVMLDDYCSWGERRCYKPNPYEVES